MRTPVGSSKIVARSRIQSSPACEPSGVILTFCANVGAHAIDSAISQGKRLDQSLISPPWERADDCHTRRPTKPYEPISTLVRFEFGAKVNQQQLSSGPRPTEEHHDESLA